jgi:hypothetical protein
MALSSSTEDLLCRSQALPEPPYSGTLYYTGVEIGFNVLGKLKKPSLSVRASEHTEKIEAKVCSDWEENRYISTVEGICATDDLLCDSDIRTLTKGRTSFPESLKEIYLLQRPQKTSQIEETVSIDKTEAHSSQTVQPTIYKYESNEYIILPVFYLIYELEVDNTLFKTVTTIEYYKDVPTSPQNKIKGEVRLNKKQSSTNGNKIYSVQPKDNTTDNRFSSLFSSFFTSTDELSTFDFEIREPTNNHNAQSLAKELRKTNQEHLSKATVKEENNVLKIKTNLNKTEITWKLPLLEFDTISKSIYRQADFHKLLEALQEDETPFVRFKPRTSENSDFNEELLDTSETWILSSFE